MKSILVIEDNTEVRENLCEILDLAGYATVQAANGKEGVQSAKRTVPDLILCDVMMPELDGFGVLRIMSRDPLLMNVPFMFLTAKADKSDFRKGMGLGADDYITKPYDEVELLDSIEIRLKKSEQLAQQKSTKESVRQFYSESKALEALTHLYENKEKRSYAKKSIIYDVNQYPKYLYYLIEGQVKTVLLTESGKELISNIYGPGDFIGVVSLLQGTVYRDHAVCTGDSLVLMIPAEDFRHLMFNNQDISSKFVKILTDQIKGMESTLMDLAYSSVRKKVSNALLNYKEKSNDDQLSISREDLAAMAGTSRESVVRTLTDFKSEGLISISQGYITILEQRELQNLPQ